jgi:tetratricopeptide (TPR) repeat protein
MLYQIIPPILVILSVVGIIIFLVKKSPEINRLEMEERKEKDRIFRATTGGLNSFSEKEVEESKIASRFQQGSLIFTEKLVKRFRIIFLKLENLLKLWGEKIRKKRNAKAGEKDEDNDLQLKGEKREDRFLETKENEGLDGIIDKIGRYNPEKRNIRERLGLKQKIKQEEVEEKFFRPIISDYMVVPKRRRETKSRLEELLIERIAANPKDIEAYERLGEYYLEVKNLEHSKECFKQVLRLNPTNSNARYKIRKLERILGS